MPVRITMGAEEDPMAEYIGLSHERGLGLLRALDLGADFGGCVVAHARHDLEKHLRWENTGLLLNSPSSLPQAG